MHNPTSLTPAYSERNIAVFCSTSDEYTPYCCVMLQSIIDHASDAWNYDLIVLHGGLSDSNQQEISALAEGHPHISIRFYNASMYTSGRDFYSGHLPIVVWYRIFAPSIFSAYEKIIYLDVDILVLADIADLYNENIGDHWLAGCRDYGIMACSNTTHLGKYYRETFGFENLDGYINSGVLLMNLAQMRACHVEQACIEAATKYKFNYFDQDMYNYVCREHIYLLEQEWNIFPCRDFMKTGLTPEQFSFWMQKKEHPRIVHYVGDKPWTHLFLDMSDLWWQHAARVPCVRQRLYHKMRGLFQLVAQRDRIRLSIWANRIMGHLTLGKRKKMYTARKRYLRDQLQYINHFIAEN